MSDTNVALERLYAESVRQTHLLTEIQRLLEQMIAPQSQVNLQDWRVREHQPEWGEPVQATVTLPAETLEVKFP